MRKGIELPVNVLVIVAIAVIVLLGLVALFMGGFGGFAGSVESTNAWSNACGPVLSACGTNHNSRGISPIEVGGRTADTFGELCGLQNKHFAYNKATFSYDDTDGTGEWSASVGSDLSDTEAANSALNGCNWACGCPQQ